MNVGVLLHHMETFGGVVVAITNRYSALCLPSIRSFSRGCTACCEPSSCGRYTQIDSAFHRRFKFILEFPMPDAAARARLWRQARTQVGLFRHLSTPAFITS